MPQEMELVLQEERPISFEIRPIEGNYLHKAICKKEMWKMLHALKK